MPFITIQPQTIINTDMIGQIRYFKNSRTTQRMENDYQSRVPDGDPVTKSTSQLIIHLIGEKVEFRSDEADEIHLKLMGHIQVLP